MTKPHNNGRLARWAISLLEYDFEIQYKAGHANCNADALSRMYENEQPAEAVNSVLSEETETDLAIQQKDDLDFHEVFCFLESGELPTDDACARRVLLYHNCFAIIDGLLYFIDSKAKGIFHLAVPKCRRA